MTVDQDLRVTGPDQPMQALKLANQVRLHRSRMRQEWKAMGPVPQVYRQAADRLENPPPWLEGANAAAVLVWLPRVGAAACRRMLVRAGVTKTDPTVGGLTPLRRASLVAQLRELAERAEREAQAAA